MVYQIRRQNLFRHFAETNHHAFLEDISFQIIDRVFGDSRNGKDFGNICRIALCLTI